MQDDAKPVAWMYERECNEVESAATVINITRWSEEQAQGWTETPLYTHPPAPAQPADVERIKALEAALKGRPSRWDYDRIASYDDAVRNWEAQAKAALGQGGVR